MSVALIVDLVRSREMSDRAFAQRAILDAFRTAEARDPARRPLWATVGDEFQAEHAGLRGALRAITLAQLLLPEGVEARIGLGLGDSTVVTDAPSPILDGTAWWRARQAIEEARAGEHGRIPLQRSAFVGPEEEAGALVSAGLHLRDQIIGSMRPRSRRIAAAILLGRTQGEIATTERISQSAVSQDLRRSGAIGLIAADTALREDDRP